MLVLTIDNPFKITFPEHRTKQNNIQHGHRAGDRSHQVQQARGVAARHSHHLHGEGAEEVYRWEEVEIHRHQQAGTETGAQGETSEG